MEYPWYEAVSSSTDLQQGDILEVVIFKVEEDSEKAEPQVYDGIVMTQTCDIVDRCPAIVFCPVWTEDQLVEAEPRFKTDGRIGQLKKRQMTGYYPISKCNIEGFEHPWRIVQFQRILELETTTVFDSLAKQQPRLRLLPPYREALAQDFARFFMRVGLPVNLET